MSQFKNPKLSLGERCTLFCEAELAANVHETYPNSFTSPRIAEYLSICTRVINGKETPIQIGIGNWCGASQSFALKSCLLTGETPPHGYRVGVVEVVADLQKNNLYQPIVKVRSGEYQIKRGDLVIWDRSTPGKPETAWFRHILRCKEVHSDGFTAISGNSGGAWKVSEHKFSQPNLLGFGEYPTLQQSILSDGVGEIEDFSKIDLNDLNPRVDTGAGIGFNFSEFYHSIVK